MVTNLQAHSPSGSLSHQHLMITPEQDLTCVICSNHPLAHCLVRDAVCASTDLNARIETYVASGRLPNNGKLPILVLDTCSVQDWATHLKKWKVAGGIIIALISSEPMSTDLEMRI